MDRYVDLLDAMYTVVIRRARAMRPLEAVYQAGKWQYEFVSAGMSPNDATDITSAIGQQIEDAMRRTRCSSERVEAVNQVFLKNGLHQRRLVPSPVRKPRRTTAALPMTRQPSGTAPDTTRQLDAALAAVEGEGGHLVYKLFDAGGALLYVGITSRGPTRLAEHYRSKPWFNEVVRVEFERFQSRDISAAREAFLIKTLHPLHNIQHNGAFRRVA